MTPDQDDRWRFHIELAVASALDAVKYAAMGGNEEARAKERTGSKHLLAACDLRMKAKEGYGPTRTKPSADDLALRFKLDK